MGILVKVMTPKKSVFEGIAEEIIIPGLDGEIGVLEGHAALITILNTGLCRIKAEGIWTPVILNGGLAEVVGDRVTLLVPEVEELYDVTIEEVASDLEKAISNLEKGKIEDENDKNLLELYQDIQKKRARFEGVKYLSKNS